MPHFLKTLLLLSALGLAGCENARPAEERNTAGPATDTTGTSGAMQQQAVQSATQPAAAPGPGPGH